MDAVHASGESSSSIVDVMVKRTRAQLSFQALIVPPRRWKVWKQRTRRTRVNSRNFKLVDSGNA